MVRFVPAPVPVAVFPGTGAVFETPTRGIPVRNPTNVLIPGRAVFDSGSWQIILGIYAPSSLNGANPVDLLILALMVNSIMGILYTQSF